MKPRSVWAAGVLGFTAGGVAWGIAGWYPASGLPAVAYPRLDQITLWLIGSVVGAVVFGSRAHWREEATVSHTLLGGAVGGATALLVGTALIAWSHVGVLVPSFPLMRAIAWSGTAGCVTLALASSAPGMVRRTLHSVGAYGLVGGAIAGALMAAPGPTELWQALAFVTVGTAIGVGVASSSVRGAVAVADRVPRRGSVPGILTLREQALFEGRAIPLGGATLACQDGRLALYPPADGVVFNGRVEMGPLFLHRGGTVLVAGERFRIQMLREPR